MPKETMTPRERLLAVLKRQSPDRVPMNYTATAEATQKLLAHLGCDFEEMIQRLHIDWSVSLEPRYVGPAPPEGIDIWGCEHRAVDYGCGVYWEVVNAPLAQYNSVEEIEANYRWPSPDDWDYAHLPGELKGKEHLPVYGGVSQPMFQYTYLRGEEQSFVDLIENPEIAHYCLDKMYELAYQDFLRIFETVPGKVMVTIVADDMGGQTRLNYSPSQIREFLLPGMRRLMDMVKQNGSHVFHHNDGSIRDILPDLIDIGIDILDPVQWRCAGMEREGLKRDFGDKLVFHGGVDNQQTLPFGTAEDVRQEVIDNLRILGEGGGYILGPCHNIQAVSPAENVVALYETGYEYGWM
jgi:uroporphyrinogen decarboxylase